MNSHFLPYVLRKISEIREETQHMKLLSGVIIETKLLR